MRKIIESTLMSADGVVGSPPLWAMAVMGGALLLKHQLLAQRGEHDERRDRRPDPPFRLGHGGGRG